MFMRLKPLVALLPALALALLLSGCQEPNPATEELSRPVPQKPSRPPDQVELRPEGSGEHSRRHIFDESGNKVEMHINYRNGDRAFHHFRTDGTLSEARLQDSKGAVKEHLFYAADGTTVIGGFERRTDGSTIREYKQLPDGTVEVTTYWWDGSLFGVELRKLDGTYTATYYWRNGNVAGMSEGRVGGPIAWDEHYSRFGLVDVRIEYINATERNVYHYRQEDSSLRIKQRWKEIPTQWGSSRLVLVHTDEYDATGTRVIRHVKMTADGYYVSETHVVQDDGTTLVRFMRSDGVSVEREEIRDASGAVISTKNYGHGELRLPTDRSLTNMPSSRSPRDNWQQQETNEWSRRNGW